MAQNYITVDQVINNYMISQTEDDYGYTSADYQLRQHALLGIREFNFDIAHNIKSTLLTYDSALGTVPLPDDYVDMIKIGTLGEDGLVYVFGNNPNINILPNEPAPNLPEDLLGFDSYLFRNFEYQSQMGRLYGLGGGQLAGQYRINTDQNRIELSINTDTSRIVMEYISDAAKCSNPCVPIYAEEALRAYIYYKVISRRSSVPFNEKARARREYYNERRLANSRLKSFNKMDAISTIQKSFKLSPKA
jgi:hypothetical protein